MNGSFADGTYKVPLLPFSCYYYNERQPPQPYNRLRRCLVRIGVNCCGLLLLEASVSAHPRKPAESKSLTDTSLPGSFSIRLLRQECPSLELVSTMYCKAHWIVVLRQSHKSFSISLVLNKLRWIKDRSNEAFDKITLSATDKCPEVGDLKGLLEDLMLPIRESCPCVQ